jgi:hypothetical protein
MIQFAEGVDRGRALFQKYPGAVKAIVESRKKQYFDSKQYAGLKNNCRAMDQYIDNNSPAVSTFISDVTPPVIRKAYIEFTSLFSKFLETDPLFSVRRTKKISPQQEHDIISTLNDNLEKTYFREKCLHWNIDHIIRYGTTVTYSFASSDYNANSLMTIKGDDNEFGEYSQVVGKGENVVISTPVHPLNTIVDPRANFQVNADFMGFIGDISVSSIRTLMENEAYVQANLKKVFEQAKQGLPDEHWYSGAVESERRDYSRGHCNITYMWTRIPIEGNEDDPTWYCVESIGGEIIRIEENPLDGNTIPLAIQRILPRQYTWYGNTPLQDKICVQNMEYWLINATIESTTRLMDRLIFYRQGELDVEAINSRHQTGGMIPYKGQEQDLSKLVFSPALPNVSFRESDWLMQEMRRQDQDTSAIPNFNPQSEGGPTNKTLGGAQMMASIGEMKAGWFVNQFAIGLKDVAKQQIVLMRNIVDEEIALSDGQTVQKTSLLGDINFSVKISNVYNYIREGIDSMNRLSQLINFKATKLPEFAAVKTSQFVEDWVRNAVKRENIEDYVDSDMLRQIEEKGQQAAIAPPAAPPMPGALPGGTPPVQPAPQGPMGVPA